MGDMFDEFMRELERRRAASEGRTPRRDGDDTGPDGGDPDGDPDEGFDREPDEGFDREPEPRAARGSDRDPEPVPLEQERRRRSGSGAPPRRGRPVGGPNDGAQPPSIGAVLRRLGIGAVVVVVFAVMFLGAFVVDLVTDVLWYQSVGFDQVFWTRLGAQVGLFATLLGVALAWLLLNIWLAGRLVPPPSPERPGTFRSWAERLAESARQAPGSGGGPARGPYGAGPRGPRDDGPFGLESDTLPDLTPIAGWILGGFAVLAALGVAGAASGAWDTILLWINRVPFSADGSVTDPIFNRDISYFLFELPFLRTVQAMAAGLFLTALFVAGARYLIAALRGGEVFVAPVRVHLAVLGGLYLLAVAAGYQLDKFELVYSQAGVGTGVAYADANARFMAYDVLTIISGLAAALLVGGAFTRWLWPLGVIIGVWVLASLVLGRLYPEAIQRFVVNPNEYAQEQPYIQNNINMTRLAFGLDDWERRAYRGEDPLTEAAIEDEALTFANARLWDYRPLHTTLSQIQVVRQYYDFVDVDTDRYIVDGQLRQVMLTGRELAIERNPTATGWVNERVIYTHGIGMAMVPVNEVTREGQPRLWVRDLPPVTTVPDGPVITQPRIYFGERPSQYVVVGARQNEFDYPVDTGTGAAEVDYRWTGTTGIQLDSTLMRLLYGLRFRDLDLLITDQVTADSQLLFNRSLGERLPRIAPFLRYDRDPYLVVAPDGRLVYIQDAYTTSSRFPHAQPFFPGELGERTGLGGAPFNYIRNSVKIVMDAYDGSMTFYIAEPDDPLVRAWAGIFPTLFRPLSELPEGLENHLRVPEERFNVQTRTFGRYHVTNPLTFYQNADLWTVPVAQTAAQALPSEAYYVVMRMPGEAEAEFLLLQPMIAANRPNMISWVAARMDPPNYGDIRYYQFPAETTIFGPAQIDARIDADPTISAQITLWSQAGSTVIRGNLIVVPVGDGLIYLQPVYLQSTASALPEFRRIIVASPTTIVWGNTLGDALSLLLESQAPGPGPTPTPGPQPTPGPDDTPAPTPGEPTPPPDGELPTDVVDLIEYANTHFELAQQAARDGDWGRYGEEMALVEAALQRLAELTGVEGGIITP